MSHTRDAALPPLVLVIAEDVESRDALENEVIRAGYDVSSVATLRDATTLLDGPGVRRPHAVVIDSAPDPNAFREVDALRDVPAVQVTSGTGASLFTADVLVTRGVRPEDSARAAATALRELVRVAA